MNTKPATIRPLVKKLKIGDRIEYELKLLRGGKHKLVRFRGKVIDIANHFVSVEETKTSVVHTDDILRVLKK